MARVVMVLNGLGRGSGATTAARRGDGLLVPPVRDPAMVAREHNLGHRQAAEIPRPRVLRAFHEAVDAGEGVLAGALVVADQKLTIPTATVPTAKTNSYNRMPDLTKPIHSF
jgi:hypothetical protein